MVFEAEVHTYLRSFLREQGLNWPHHLTMARIVARALRLGRSALMQTSNTKMPYSISYLTPALLSEDPVIIVAPRIRQQQLSEEIPQLVKWLATEKQINHLIITSPESWLEDRLFSVGRFPDNVPTIIDGAEDLEQWTFSLLTVSIVQLDWEELTQVSPTHTEAITDVRVQLTLSLFAHPQNPYDLYLVEDSEVESLAVLLASLESNLTPNFAKFKQLLEKDDQILWASIVRETGQFSLHLAPALVAPYLKPIWSKQPVVLIGSFLDLEQDTSIYRSSVGLPDLISLKFSPNRNNELIQLYLPDKLPLPNTPQFQEVLIQEIRRLVALSSSVKKLVVLLVEDVPLKMQVGVAIAAQEGSRVQVEKTNLVEDGILVTGWEFWRQHQDSFPSPQLLVIATLPIPSPENPIVASRVAYYKHRRRDWFRLYLLPTALRELQRAISSLRETQGVVALLDNRVNSRSYGSQILTALEPCARINYIDPNWFT